MICSFRVKSPSKYIFNHNLHNTPPRSVFIANTQKKYDSRHKLAAAKCRQHECQENIIDAGRYISNTFMRFCTSTHMQIKGIMSLRSSVYLYVCPLKPRNPSELDF